MQDGECVFFIVLFTHLSCTIRERFVFLHVLKQLIIYTMLHSTTPSLEGYSVVKYHGVVTGETIIGANLFRDFFAGIRDMIGGRAGSYEEVLRKAKDTSMQEMEELARQMGANAIIGISLDYETIGANGSMLMVSCSGTAVTIEKHEE